MASPTQWTCAECSPGRSLCLTKSSACGRLWQFAHPREGERVLALESREGTRASRRVEEGLSRSLSGGGGKPSCPSPSAGDRRELPSVRLFEAPWTIAYQAPPSMGFSRQEYWSGLPFHNARDMGLTLVWEGSSCYRATKPLCHNY